MICTAHPTAHYPQKITSVHQVQYLLNITKKLDLEILKTSAKCTTANINVALNRKQLKFNNNGEK